MAKNIAEPYMFRKSLNHLQCTVMIEIDKGGNSILASVPRSEVDADF